MIAAVGVRALALAVLVSGLAIPAQGQQIVRGTVYDSLLGAPLSNADLWVRGTNWRANSDSRGRFSFDSVTPGDYTVLVSHPDLDSVGLYTLTLPMTIRADNTARLVTLATPSLATLWARRCGAALTPRVDSGLVVGVIKDAATGAHLAGAGVLVGWLDITQTDRTSVSTEERTLTTRTDSTGTYYACGVSRDVAIAVRGYAARDSTGMIDVQLGRRGVGRQDLSIALAPSRRPAVLRGTAKTDEGVPLVGGRVSVDEGPSTVVGADGGYTLRGVPPGTQWVTVRAIGRTPIGRAVDFHEGDTTRLDVQLPPTTVTLAPLKVVAEPSRLLQGFVERRSRGFGYFRGEEELQGAGSLRAALSSLPAVRFQRGAAGLNSFVVVLPHASHGYCVPALYIDGLYYYDYDPLLSYSPDDLVGVELYPRAVGAPIEFQRVSSGCGVLVIWTKYLK